jgi:dihydrofolate synthase/folylpolyglutamate synthase
MGAIEKIHEFERFGSVLGLERMNIILEKLGNPQDDLKVIHVAGTNGKGSICKYIYEVLRAAGYKAGLYTSPFLEVFNERIELDGEYISDEDLSIYTQRVLDKAKEMVEEGYDSPTEFEVVTAIAFLYFKEKGCDYAVLEVGLGGRGDSTNVVKSPLCSVIASISLDHTDRLGDTIAKIAFEKAGIIKENCPVVINTDKKEARDVFVAKAEECHAEIFDAIGLKPEITAKTLEGCIFNVKVMEKEYHDIEISMGGDYQVSNAMAALYALTLLNARGKINVSDAAIAAGMKKAKQIGRFEIMGREPFVIIDGAHNPDGSLSLKTTINQFFHDKKVLMIVGILADKDVGQVLDNFRGITDEFVATEPGNPRKMKAAELAENIYAKGGKCIIMETPEKAVDYAMSRRGDFDLILFAGSLYLIGEVRRLLRDVKKDQEGDPVL